LEELGGDGKIIQKCILQQLDGTGEGALIELICRRIGAGGGPV
jgi:hypothetical protein